MKNYLIVFIIFCCIFTVSCNKNNDNDAKSVKVSPVSFNVDTKIISQENTIDEYNLCYSVPKNAVIVSNVDIKKINENLAKISDSRFVTDYKKIYLDKQAGLICSVGQSSNINHDNLDSSFNDLYSYYVKTFTTAKIDKSTFLHNELLMNQLIVANESFVLFRIFVETPDLKIIEFNYLAPKVKYPEVVASIESSIGTIKINHN